MAKKIKKYNLGEEEGWNDRIVAIMPLNNFSRREIKRSAKGAARNKELAQEIINNEVLVGGDNRREERYFYRQFNRERNRIAKENRLKEIERQASEMMSSDAWKTIPIRHGENFEANQHAREYVKDINTAATIGIGLPMVAASPVLPTVIEAGVDGVNFAGDLLYEGARRVAPKFLKDFLGGFFNPFNKPSTGLGLNASSPSFWNALGGTTGITTFVGGLPYMFDQAKNQINKIKEGTYTINDVPESIMLALGASEGLGYLGKGVNSGINMIDNFAQVKKINKTKKIASSQAREYNKKGNDVGNQWLRKDAERFDAINEVKNLKPEVEIKGNIEYENINEIEQFVLPTGEVVNIPVTRKGEPKLVKGDNVVYKETMPDFSFMAKVDNLKYIPNLPQTKSVPEIQKYYNDVKTFIGNNGALGGSTALYKDGYIGGKSPHDLEIVTTKSKLQPLQQQLEFRVTNQAPNAIQGTSKYAGQTKDVDIQVIDETANGYAKGKIAHEIYRTMYPVEYAKASTANAKSTTGVANQDLLLPNHKTGKPYTADELLEDYIKLGLDKKKTLIDALSVSKTGASYTGDKLNRPIMLLTNENPAVINDVSEAIETIGKFTYGDDYLRVSQIYPNIKFDNIDANRKFLQALGIDSKYASDEKIMKNIVEYFNLQTSSLGRGVDANDLQGLISAAHTTYSPHGGTVSGGGGNSIMLSQEKIPWGQYHHVGQYPILGNTQSIKDPYELYNAYNIRKYDGRLSGFLDKTQIDELNKLGLNVNENMNVQGLLNELGRVNDPTVAQKAGQIMNQPALHGRNYNQGYFGRLTDTPLSESFRTVKNDFGDINYEMGRTLDSYSKQTSSIYKNVVNTLNMLELGIIPSNVTQTADIKKYVNLKSKIESLSSEITKLKDLEYDYNMTSIKNHNLYNEKMLELEQKMEEIFKDANTLGITLSALTAGSEINKNTKKRIGGTIKTKSNKKMLGAAIIGAASSLIGAGIQAASQKRLYEQQQADQRKLQNIQNTNAMINNLNQQANNNMDWAYDKFKPIFKLGGTQSKFKNRF